MNIGIIDSNVINYSETDHTHTRLKRDNLEEDIEEYITFTKASDSIDAMQLIIEKCKFSPEELIYTTIIYETPKYIYYMIHTVDDNNQKKDINKIAIYLSRDLYRITGSVGILKEEIKTNNDNVMGNLYLNDMLDIYVNCFVHKGVIIDNNNGEINEIKFIFNPIDWYNIEEASNIKFIEYEIFDKILMMFIEIKPKNNIINEKASIIYGKKVNGKVIFALRRKNEDIKQTKYIYEDLTKDLAEKLLYILSTKQENIKESEEEIKKMKVYNFYTVLENRYNKYVKKYGYTYSLLEKIKDQISANDLALQSLQGNK